MTQRQYIKQIANKYKRQYCKRKKWVTYDRWDIQPEKIYLIMLELKTFKTVEALTNDSWTRYYKRRFKSERI